MNVKFFSNNQKIEVETMICFGFEVQTQLATGTIIMSNNIKPFEDATENEVYILKNGKKVGW